MEPNFQPVFLRVLLNRFHKSEMQQLLKCLPQAEAQQILLQNISSEEVSFAFDFTQDLLNRIHYSWIAEEIKKKPPKLQPFFVASLPPLLRDPLAKLLKTPPFREAPKSLVNKYFYQEFCTGLNLQDRLPPAYLPKTQFFSLMQANKNQLVDLVDFLGLFDLAEELRSIVSTKNIKDIYACLTPKKQQFLRVCLHQKERVISPKLHLDKWDGNCEELNKLLHRRGINRLGKALSGQHSDFIWLITQMFDIGRGTLLAKEISPQEIPAITHALGLQVLNTIEFLDWRKQ